MNNRRLLSIWSSNRLLCLFVVPFCYLSLSAQILRPKCISGIYPCLANFNNEGECGTGAVVSWANRLWTISYGPHLPFGSSDKLYEISTDLNKVTRIESIGGTPADRMIHRESNQLFIGPYAIDSKRNVRVIPISTAPGRFTSIARSVTDPKNKVVIATMEQGIYEVDVHSLKVNTWFKDGNQMKKEGASTYQSSMLKGVHGKGFYSGQGVYIYANNGEDCPEAIVNPRIQAGVLAEYDGKLWKQIRRNQFTDITGPGGIYGNTNSQTDPIWTIGWDYKSILVGVRDVSKGWSFYRIPKASNSYDGAHGWNTEWPRIRNIGTDAQPYYLMTMHGMFWRFPQRFTAATSAGIRPLSSYLKVIGDFCSWNNRLVCGCDDSAKSEFLNTRKAKGGIAAPGQSQSNLWFTSLSQLPHLGTTDACASVWQNEALSAHSTSDPLLLGGWNHRTCWLRNYGDHQVHFIFEIDKSGNGQWRSIREVVLSSGESRFLSFDDVEGEWVRVHNIEAAQTTISFVYSDSKVRKAVASPMFNAISSITDNESRGGLLYALGNNKRCLGILASSLKDGNKQEQGYYELDGNMSIVKKQDITTADFIRSHVAIPSRVVTVDKGSYLIIDDHNNHWRLPLGNIRYGDLMKKQAIRICREVSTERDLFNCGGTFYELPAENAGGYAKIRPISSHRLQINDYCSYRGLLVMTGLKDNINKSDNEHVFVSSDKKCAIWAGVIDDLWKLGKPVGIGGPWVDSLVKAGAASDPYLLGWYDKKTVTLSHKSNENVTFTVEMDPTGDGSWMKYASYTVRPGEKLVKGLPNGHIARWIRFVTDKDTEATAWLVYK